MDYGIAIAAVSLFGTLALVLADVMREPETPATSLETVNEVEQEQRRAA